MRLRTIRLTHVVLAAAAACCLAGCAVTKEPLSTSAINAAAAELEAEALQAPEPVNGKLDVNGAIARALKFNASLRVSEREVALEAARARAAGAGLLPGIVSDSSYYGRSTGQAFYSTLSPSTGNSSDLALTWNVLDFGLSYVRAGQQSDKTRYQHEEFRRAALQLASETRVAYWRTVAARRVEKRLLELRGDVAKAIATSDAALANPRLDPMTTLSFSRDILNDQRELNDLSAELAGSEAQLRQLINVPPDQTLTLDDKRDDNSGLFKGLETRDAVKIALANRPEIRSLLYELRISDDDVAAAVIQVLPGFSFNGGLGSSAFTVLANSNWLVWGARAAWNVISLVRLPSELETIEAQKAISRQKAIAAAVAIVMQCYISNDNLKLQRRAYADAQRFLKVQKQILNHVNVAVDLGQSPAQLLTRERIGVLLAEARMLTAFANVQHATGNYLATLGLDETDLHNVSAINVSQLALELRSRSSLPLTAEASLIASSATETRP